MIEEWKPISEFKDYEISNLGRVRTKKRDVRYTHAVTGKEHFRTTNERLLKIYVNSLTNYKFVQLYLNKKAFNKTIHRLVASAFIRNDFNLPIVNHIDGNKHNNLPSNLEWCTEQYNYEQAMLTGLTAKGERVGTSVLNEKCVCAIKALLKDNYYTHHQIASFFEVSRATVSLIHEGKTWRHLTNKELNITL